MSASVSPDDLTMSEHEHRSSTVPVDLLVFTSAGRRECLDRMVRGLRPHPACGQFSRRILAVDGMDAQILQQTEVSWFTHLVISVRRQGYFSNIGQAIALLQSPYFFWCEDDWELTRLPPLEEALEALGRFPNLAQVRVPKQKELLLEDKRLGELTDGIWAQDQFYSLNPHYGRSELMRHAFAEGLTQGAGGQNVEIALSRWMRKQGHIFAAWAPSAAHAAHFGQEVAGGHSDYGWHLIPESGPAAGEAPAPPGDTALRAATQVAPEPAPSPDTQRSCGPASPLLRRPSVLWEFLTKALYALWAVTKAVVSIPFSRQARAFVRSTWQYWHPDFSDPSSLGPTFKDIES